MSALDGREFRVIWSEEDGEFVGLCDDAYLSLSWLAPTSEEALRGIRALVAEIGDETKETET